MNCLFLGSGFSRVRVSRTRFSRTRITILWETKISSRSAFDKTFERNTLDVDGMLEAVNPSVI